MNKDFLKEFVKEMHKYWLKYTNILTLDGKILTFRGWFLSTFPEIPEQHFLVGVSLAQFR